MIEISCILCVVQILGARIKINRLRKWPGCRQSLTLGNINVGIFSFHYPEWNTYSYSSCSSQLMFNLVHFKLRRENCRKGFA